ncbi:melanophilin [Hemibagrus wyckioides]|uniref:melanophilin n=1 Tax=Hemibagrus wyckioides TaxID=337641 RepID=UPI00266CB6FD|nr:melanophilin [Hemibagrus wyckioides]
MELGCTSKCKSLKNMTLDITKQMKLDLSRLAAEEVIHIWQVIWRDFNLRKKEEERLRNLQSNILTEDMKRHLLTYQSNLSNSFCIHCLQLFKFLLDSKYQCRNCKAFICKGCSWLKKNKYGCLCDQCHKSKVLRIGKLEWFHDNVFARFKQSGSAKVMMSLYKRLHEVFLPFSQDDQHSKCSGRQQYKLAENEDELLSLLDLEEMELKQKLKKLTKNISDEEKSSNENFTSDEDDANRVTDEMKPLGREEIYFATTLKGKTVTSAYGNFFRNELSSVQKTTVDFERRTITQRKLSFYQVSTISCELSRLEDEVAMAVARVQSTLSEVTDIQNRIAALGQE